MSEFDGDAAKASEASEASFTRLYAYMLVFPAEGTADYEQTNAR